MKNVLFGACLAAFPSKWQQNRGRTQVCRAFSNVFPAIWQRAFGHFVPALVAKRNAAAVDGFGARCRN